MFIFNNKFSFKFSYSKGKCIIFLRNAGTYLLVNMAQNPRILLSLRQTNEWTNIIINLKNSALKKEVESYSETLERFYENTHPLH